MDKLYSHHIFLFPFSIELDKSLFKNKKFEFLDFVEDKLDKNQWKSKLFTVDNPDTYNQQVYFHDFVEPALFPTKKEGILRTYEFKLAKKPSFFHIELKKNEQKFLLEIESITLNIYDTEVGILVFNLKNYQHSSQKDILVINDYGRRLFPPFLSVSDFNKLTDNTKDSLLPNKIILENVLKPSIETNFDKFDTSETLKTLENSYLPNHVMQVLGSSFVDTRKLHTQEKLYIQPILDDRMFVLSWYYDKQVDILKELDKKERIYNYNSVFTDKIELNRAIDFWYQYIFVDSSGPTVKNLLMKKDLLTAHTYERWIGNGIFFGVSRYSFVLYGKEGFFFNQILNKHFEILYMPMVMLCLAKRASILKFSYRVTNIAEKINKNRFVLDEIDELHRDYIRFINLLYFREVTAQEQGIELYDMLMNKMKIHEHAKDLDNEIQELYQFSQSKQSARLTMVATVFGFFSILVGLASLDIVEDFGKAFPHKGYGTEGYAYYYFIVAILAIIAGLVFFYYERFKFKNNFNFLNKK